MKKIIVCLTAALMALMPMTVKAEEIPRPVYADITVSEYEGYLLERILWAEANDQSFEGQKAVIEVIFNRVRSKDWPDTIEGVLSQKSQFSTWKDRNRVTPTEIQSDVISEVLRETETVIPGDYVYFSTKKHKWMHDCFKLEDHYFGR